MFACAFVSGKSRSGGGLECVCEGLSHTWADVQSRSGPSRPRFKTSPIQSKWRRLKVFPGPRLMEKRIIKNQFGLWSFWAPASSPESWKRSVWSGVKLCFNFSIMFNPLKIDLEQNKRFQSVPVGWIVSCHYRDVCLWMIFGWAAKSIRCFS